MEQGTVLWFNDAKGFGFIKVDSGEKDIFVHHTGISMEGYRKLKEGQRVTFEVGDGPKGRQAINVEVMSEGV